MVFDDEFTTVPYMERGEVPPHWHELFKQSRELSTEEQFELTMDWLSDGAETTCVKKDESDFSLVNSDHTSADSRKRPNITSPFDILSDQPDVVRETDAATHLSCTVPSAATIEHVDKRDVKLTGRRNSTCLRSSTRDRPEARTKRVKIDVTFDQKCVDSGEGDTEEPRKMYERDDAQPRSHPRFTLPKRIDLSQAGLRRSSRLKELRKKDENNKAVISRELGTTYRE